MVTVAVTDKAGHLEEVSENTFAAFSKARGGGIGLLLPTDVLIDTRKMFKTLEPGCYEATLLKKVTAPGIPRSCEACREI